MTLTEVTTSATSDLAAKANRHLWGHFARHGEGITPPIITRGEGTRIFDDKGNSYIDGLSGLFVVQVGHGREELAAAAAKQAEQLAFFPLWSYATPSAIELADALANFAAERRDALVADGEPVLRPSEVRSSRQRRR